MVKRILIASSFVVLCGCYEQSNNSYQFNWASVNKRVLEKEIQSRAKKLNPYPNDIGMDKDKLYNEKKKLSRQINKLENAARDKCYASQRESKQEKVESNVEGYGRQLPSGLVERDIVLRTCLKNIRSDPLIMELEKKKDELASITKMRNEHDRRVGELSQKYTQQLIEQYSKSKYEVVVNGKDGTVLYNSTGLALDITDALIAEIDEKSLVLTGSKDK